MNEFGKVRPITNHKEFKNFPIKIETAKKLVIDTELAQGYDQYLVCANGFVIAHFLDETSMFSYLNYLKQYGFSSFPPKIIQILEKLYNRAI